MSKMQGPEISFVQRKMYTLIRIKMNNALVRSTHTRSAENPIMCVDGIMSEVINDIF